MSRHYFTHSFGIDSGGDTSNLPPDQDQAIAIEGAFVSGLFQGSVNGPVTFTVKGLRGVSGVIGMPEQDATFYYNPSTTQIVNTYFPVQGRTNVGGGISFSMAATSPDSASAQVTVWGYYTDSE